VLWPVGGEGDFGDDAGENFLSILGVVEEVLEDGLGGDGVFLRFPAIVVGDHGESGESDAGFESEFGLWDIGHADDVEAELAVDF